MWRKVAVQPWINEGRMLATLRQGRGRTTPPFAGAEAGGGCGGQRTISPLDAGTVRVCRNVAVVDGFPLELPAGKLAGGEAHLTRLERRGVSGRFLAEFRLQLALARGRAEEAAVILDGLCEPPAYLPMLASYGAAIGLVTNDTREFARDVLLLVALLDGWAESKDDVASILHSLLWLARMGAKRIAPCSAARRRTTMSDGFQTRRRRAVSAYSAVAATIRCPEALSRAILRSAFCAKRSGVAGRSTCVLTGSHDGSVPLCGGSTGSRQPSFEIEFVQYHGAASVEPWWPAASASAVRSFRSGNITVLKLFNSHYILWCDCGPYHLREQKRGAAAR